VIAAHALKSSGLATVSQSLTAKLKSLGKIEKPFDEAYGHHMKSSHRQFIGWWLPVKFSGSVVKDGLS